MLHFTSHSLHVQNPGSACSLMAVKSVDSHLTPAQSCFMDGLHGPGRHAPTHRPDSASHNSIFLSRKISPATSQPASQQYFPLTRNQPAIQPASRTRPGLVLEIEYSSVTLQIIQRILGGIKLILKFGNSKFSID